jgi:hypothetical protein
MNPFRRSFEDVAKLDAAGEHEQARLVEDSILMMFVSAAARRNRGRAGRIARSIVEHMTSRKHRRPSGPTPRH